MINLLPPNEKRELDREYRLRRVALALSAAIGLVAAALIMMAPIYITTAFKSRTINAGIASAVAKDASDELQYKKQIDEAKFLLKLLKPQDQGETASAIIAMLTADKTSEIKITSISYTQNAPGATVVVQGMAKTREDLSAYTTTLSQEKSIKNVDVPVSNFTKDTDISYTFTITAN